MNDSGETVSLRVIFRGRVQGVGFRWTTRGIAARYTVEGYVRNQTDGTVELVACGERAVVRQFLDELQQTMSGNISDIEQSEFDSAETFAGFSIRH